MDAQGIMVGIGGVFVFGGIFAYIFLIERWRKKKRVQALRDLAAEFGLSYKPEVPLAEMSPVENFDTLCHNDSTRFTNVLQGTAAGVAITAYDFFQPKRRDDAFGSICIVESESLTLPRMKFGRRNFLKDLSDWIEGAGPVEFPDDPEFAEEFTVHAPDPQAARAALTPEVRAFLRDPEKKYTRHIPGTETIDNALAGNLVQRLTAEDLRTKMELCFELHRLWSKPPARPEKRKEG